MITRRGGSPPLRNLPPGIRCAGKAGARTPITSRAPCSDMRLPEPEAAGDDAPQHLARPAAQRERRRLLHQKTERPLERGPGVEPGLHAEQLMDRLGDRLFEAR